MVVEKPLTERSVQSLLPMLIHLVKDDQESVRKLALESTPAFARTLGSTDALPEVLDACVAVLTDRSWRVRHVAASKMPALAEALGPELAVEHLVKSFVALLQARAPPVTPLICMRSRIMSPTYFCTAGVRLRVSGCVPFPRVGLLPVSYTHLTLPTTPYV